MDIEIYVDMDGVLADFDARVEENAILKSYKDRWNKLLARHGREDLRLLKKDEIKKLFSGPQTDPVMADLKKAWTNYSNHIFVIAGKKGFFLGLEEMPGARELLMLAQNLTGKKPHILTAPIKGNPNCEPEKRQWIENHFSGLFDQFYCTGDKHTKAAPNAILIDDRPKYIKPFQDAGGSVVYYQNYQQASKDLRKVVNELVKGKSKADSNDLLEVVVSEIVENVLDKMGKNKVSTSIRAGSVAGPVYTEFPSGKESDIVKQVSKNLHKKPYSHHPPMMGISNKQHQDKKNK